MGESQAEDAEAGDAKKDAGFDFGGMFGGLLASVGAGNSSTPTPLAVGKSQLDPSFPLFLPTAEMCCGTEAHRLLYHSA